MGARRVIHPEAESREPVAAAARPPAPFSRESGRPARERRDRGRLLPGLLAMALGLLVAAWVFGNPPGYTPDEPNHYTKAVGVGQLDPLGKPAKYGIGPGFGPKQLEWINQAARAWVLPPGLAPDGFYCALFKPEVTAKCLVGYEGVPEPADRMTYVGTYEPFMYFLPGVAANVGDDAVASLFRARAVSGALAAVLLAIAVFLLWSPAAGGWSLLGVLAAATPMVVFMASGLSPSGPEIGAAFCFLAALIRISRPESRGGPNTAAWWALAAAGVVLILSRSLGICFFAVYLGLFVALNGPRGAWSRFREAGRVRYAVAAILGVALVVEIAWQVLYQPHTPLPIGQFPDVVRLTLRDFPRVIKENIGVFGWGDVGMPPMTYPLWTIMVTMLAVVAWIAAPRRGRRLLTAVLLTSIAATFVVAMLPYGYFPYYGRYVLAIWIVLPLIAGELLARHRGDLGSAVPDRLPLWIALVAAGVHLAGWWANGQRYAVTADGPLFFPPSAEWSPPLGWWPWIAAMVAATGAMVAVGALTRARDGAPLRPAPAVDPPAVRAGG